jgi:hypothetical protein
MGYEMANYFQPINQIIQPIVTSQQKTTKTAVIEAKPMFASPHARLIEYFQTNHNQEFRFVQNHYKTIENECKKMDKMATHGSVDGCNLHGM